MICAWIGCERAARANRVCNAHRLRTLRAGRRAAGLIEQRRGRPRIEPRMSPAERLDELEWLLHGGTWVPGAVARLGWTVRAACRAAERAGRRDLSARLRAYEDILSAPIKEHAA